MVKVLQPLNEKAASIIAEHIGEWCARHFGLCYHANMTATGTAAFILAMAPPPKSPSAHPHPCADPAVSLAPKT
jgi:hypothetical protein